jgi:hypothetical protein
MTLMYHPGLSEATSDFLVLMSLGLLAGAFSGFGVSLGITAVQNIAYRHSHWWTVGGGAIGGAAIGGVVNFLGLDILRALFGQELSGITGAFEGLIMGIGLASGLALAERNSTTGVWRKILFAALGAMCSAIILTSIQGNLFSGSIDIIARSFSQSQLNLQKISAVNGETMFSRFSRIVLGGLEGLLFGSFTTAGMVFFRGTSAEKGS